MARIAYRYAIPRVAVLYAELFPGYSIYKPIQSDRARDSSWRAACSELDLAEHLFVNAGLGSQKGWQTPTATSNAQTSYVRVALGVGARLSRAIPCAVDGNSLVVRLIR